MFTNPTLIYVSSSKDVPRLWCPNVAIFERLILAFPKGGKSGVQRFICRPLKRGTTITDTQLRPPLHSYSVEVACVVDSIELFRKPTDEELRLVDRLLSDGVKLGNAEEYSLAVVHLSHSTT